MASLLLCATVPIFACEGSPRCKLSFFYFLPYRFFNVLTGMVCYYFMYNLPLQQRLCNAAKKALAKIPTRNVKLTDKVSLITSIVSTCEII